MYKSIVAYIQARMSSERLPGKVLKKIKGVPLIDYLYNQVLNFRELDKIIILTSDHPSDDELSQYCKDRGWLCFRGDLLNVANRFKQASLCYESDYFIRLNADSPLHHKDVIARGVDIIKQNNISFLTNANPRTFPSGMGLEIIDTNLYINSYKHFSEEEDFEHVTKYFYRHYQDFTTFNLTDDKNRSDWRLAVDTKSDYDRIEKIVSKLATQPYIATWQEQAMALEKHCSELLY
jgi:spore coat polysaccharide biosynthesis protein SpsF